MIPARVRARPPPAVEQHVAQGAAAKGRQAGHHAHAHRVELLARGAQQARQGKGQRGHGLDGGEQCGEPGGVGHGGPGPLRDGPSGAQRKGMGVARSTATAVTLFLGEPSISLSE